MTRSGRASYHPLCVCGHTWGRHRDGGCQVIVDQGTRVSETPPHYRDAVWCECVEYRRRDGQLFPKDAQGFSLVAEDA